MTRPEPAPADRAAPEGPWRRRMDTGWRVTPVGLVLLPAGHADPVTVTGSAAAVWDLLAEPITRTDLADRLAERFGVEPATVQADVDALLARLAQLTAIYLISDSVS